MTIADEYMLQAIHLAFDGMRHNRGGPFGAVIVKNDTVIGRGCNQVTSSNDPTAHAEMVAIRQASATISNFCLSGAVLYTSCEPCPMCAMACVWAGVSRIYFGASIDDAAEFGNQVKIYCREIAEKAWYELQVEGGLLREECRELFRG